MGTYDMRRIIWEYTRRIKDNTSNTFSPLFEKHGLTLLQVRILMELFHDGSHTVGKLGESIYVAGATVSVMCKKLESRGLVERVRDSKDERVVKVALTAKGREIVLSIDEAMGEIMTEHIAAEPEETFREIVTGLQKLNDLLERIGRSQRKV